MSGGWAGERAGDGLCHWKMPWALRKKDIVYHLFQFKTELLSDKSAKTFPRLINHAIEQGGTLTSILFIPILLHREG